MKMSERLMKRVLLTVFVCALSLAPWEAVAQQRGRRERQPQRQPRQNARVYRNPVLAGDYPDPSIVRVGGDYWATATTSEWGPEYPILHSRDLVNWRIVGSIFTRPPTWSVGSYWAPEIAEHRGRFYVYYVARKRGGPLCVAVATAPRPTGPYRDHGPLVCQEVGSIDGFPVTDEQGRRYLLWKEDGNSVSKPTPIWAQRLSADGTRLVGERTELLRNTEAWEKHPRLPFGDLVEGPAVVRRNGWFYMFYSGNFCCDRDCMYAVGVARSRKLLGPWEKHPRNPIMSGNDAWKCPGHGTLVTDTRGRDWLMYHAYHPKDFVYVGRQALLDEVQWGADGWPTINEGRGPSTRSPLPLDGVESNAEYNFFDDFTTARLLPGWQWPTANAPVTRLEQGGWLMLADRNTGARGSTAETTNYVPAIVAQSTTAGDYVATTIIDTRGLRPGAYAGLAAYGDADNALGLSVGSDGRMVLWRRERRDEKPAQQTGTILEAPRGARVHLRMTATDGRRFRFSASADGRNWRDAGGELDGDYLPRWDRGIRVALAVGGVPGAAARFDSLRIESAAR